MQNSISIASYSFHGLLAEGKIDAFGYLESCKYRYDLNTADFWNGLIGTADENYIIKLRQEADARGIEVVNYHVDGVHLWEDDPEARERNYQGAIKHLHLAALLRAKTVRFDTGGGVGPISNEQMDYLATRYQEYARFGEEYGFLVGPENHWGLSLYADTMEKLALAVDHPSYGILLHMGHWEDCSPDDGDRRLARWAVHTHVDANVTRNDLATRMDILLHAGYRGCWGVEHHSAQNEYAEVAYQLAEVRRVLARKLWDIQNRQTQDFAASVKDGNPLLTEEQERG